VGSPELRPALAELLLTHADPADIHRWWWNTKREGSRTWIATAADMTILHDLNDADAAHLLACPESPTGDDDEPLVSLLLRPGATAATTLFCRFA
jgi:hypothetical protein